MFKVFNSLEDVDVHKLFSLSMTNTRNPEGKILVQSCSTNTRKSSFSLRVANHWNSLPPNIKFANNTNTFKNLLDKNPKFTDMFFEYDE